MRTKILFALSFFTLGVSSQTFETKFTRSLSDVLGDIEKRFRIRLKYNVDTTGLKIPYADFRIRPYSVEESLTNVLSPFDFKPVYQEKNIWKIKPYEYPRRQPEDGKKMIAYLSSLYNNKEEWENRKAILKKEVRERLEIDPLLAQCSSEKPQVTKVRKHDGYTVRNFCMKTLNGHTVKGSIYAPNNAKIKKTFQGKFPLIICPNGHFQDGRYGKVQQLRLGSLARMGAICVDYDLWGWGESEDEVGKEAHQTSEAHIMQILNGVRILDWMITRKDVDITHIGVNGGSGGGTQAVLLSVIDNRYTVSCPVVSMSSWFDGGCPCESGKPIQLAGGGTCNAELAALFAPKPMMIVSDGGDWTSTTPDLEYPYLQRIYGFYGKADEVSNIHLPDERHDFGINKRNAVYECFIKHFSLDRTQLDEDKITIEDENTLRFKPKLP